MRIDNSGGFAICFDGICITLILGLPVVPRRL